VGQAAAADFGFNWLNRQIVHGTGQIAEALRATQTGYLNWNVLGIVAGFVVVLGILALG